MWWFLRFCLINVPVKKEIKKNIETCLVKKWRQIYKNKKDDYKKN
jgi:hypothetical protein